MFEVLSLFPLFPGVNELDQIEKNPFDFRNARS